ncbi:MAG TPA: di-heme oxidoredictase family protein [Kofleriaceae bacterium]
MRLWLLVLVLGACGDNRPAPPAIPDCSAWGPPATGLGLDAAREAHRRSALRARLRYRDAVEPGYVLHETALAADQDRIERGEVCGGQLYEVGRILFEHQFDFSEGLAGSDEAFTRVQNGRHGGPETTSCLSCHWRNGVGGGGALPDAAYIGGDGDRVSSADARNPPALIGSGAVQAIAQDMTAQLAALRTDVIARAKKSGALEEVALVANGTSFGTLYADPRGNLRTGDVSGVDADLVIRPFGWKGTAATISEFIAEAAFLHMGLQSEDAALVGAPDPLELDDGPLDELTSGQITALAVYVASLETPIMTPHVAPVDRNDPAGAVEPYLVDEWARGRTVFEEIRCADCHTPMMTLPSPTVTIASPATGGGVTIDLSTAAEAPRIARDVDGGYPVFVFSDFKRHDLGEENASQHLQHGLAPRLYLTRRLWGVGDSAPYFYDGQSASIEHAIERHGGEAARQREMWRALPTSDRSALRVFLTSLRRSPRLSIP